MVVLPVDAVLLLTPLLWAPQQRKAIVTMAVLALLLVTGGRRYRARLHLSVLDELPTLIGRLLTAAALVATVIALRHEQEAVTTFLVNIVICVGMVVVGRVATTQLIGWSRRRRITAHRTLLIGGGALAAELARILHDNPRYGLAVVGFVDDGTECVADAVLPHLGHLNELDRVVGETGADVLLVADGNISDRYLIDAVRTPACTPCDLLVVPRMHHFAPQTGPGDHIGSIPVIRMRTPNLQGPAWLVKRVFDVVAAGVLITLAAPVIACSALAVRLESGPGVIFRQTRVGRDGVLFDCLKIRTMPPVDPTESATALVGERRQPNPSGRPFPAAYLARRAAAAVEHPARRHDAGRPPPGAPVLRRPVLRRVRPLRPPAPGAGRPDRARAGQRPARGHVDRRPHPLRQLLHRALVALARHQDRDPHLFRDLLRPWALRTGG